MGSKVSSLATPSGVCDDSSVESIEQSSSPPGARTRGAPMSAAQHWRAWLAVAFAAQVVNGLVGLSEEGSVRQSLIASGVIGIVLLALVRRRHAWAWWIFIVMNAMGFIVTGVGFALAFFIASVTIEINWISIALSTISVLAILAPGILPRESSKSTANE